MCKANVLCAVLSLQPCFLFFFHELLLWGLLGMGFLFFFSGRNIPVTTTSASHRSRAAKVRGSLVPLEAELVGWVAPTGISPAVGPDVPEKRAISKQRPVLCLHCLCKYLCFIQQAKAPKQPGAGGAEEEEEE